MSFNLRRLFSGNSSDRDDNLIESFSGFGNISDLENIEENSLENSISLAEENTLTEMSVLIKPPKPFINKGNPAEDWKKWLKSYEWFENATEMVKKSELVQASTFMNVAGPEIANILETLNVSDDDQQKIAPLKKAFNDYFEPQRNATYERNF